ncbi:MAG: transporter [Naasia sp.]
MVAHLLRLRLLLLRNSLRRSTWQIVGLVFGGIYGLFILIGAVAGLIALSFAPVELARTVIVFAGAITLAGWLLLPLVLNGIDQTLDTSRLVAYPIPMRQLLLGLTLAGLVGIPGIVTLIASLGTIGTWIRSPGAAVAAGLCAVLGTVTCVVGSRAVAAAASGIGTGRRTRELMGVIVFIPLLLLGPLLAGIGSGVEATAESLPRVADAIAWSPLGAVWAVPADLAVGDAIGAVAKLAIALATLLVLLIAWRHFLAAALVTPPRGQVGHASRGMGLLARVPGTPTGAVTARALTYWVRDPRYLRSLIIVPLIPVLVYFYSTTNDSTAIFLAAGPLVAFTLALSIYADVSLDNTAFALHVSAGVSGAADRAGRVFAVLLFGVPLVIIATVVTVAAGDAWTSLPALLGIGLGVLTTGLGVASVVSARVVFPAPAPGDNPFKSPPGAGAASVAASFATWGALAVLALPEIVLGIVAIVVDSTVLGVVALAVGVLLGSGLLVVGIRVGGRILDHRAPDLLQQLMRQR